MTTQTITHLINSTATPPAGFSTRDLDRSSAELLLDGQVVARFKTAKPYRPSQDEVLAAVAEYEGTAPPAPAPLPRAEFWTATPTKLGNNEWGVRIMVKADQAAPAAGDKVLVRTRAGKEFSKTIEFVLETSGRPDNQDRIAYTCSCVGESRTPRRYYERDAQGNRRMIRQPEEHEDG